uniref:Lysozyme-like 4 n=1 Tax=Rattus norvegicus TaxID=10116 RepID=A0ABK0L7Z5_RAT
MAAVEVIQRSGNGCAQRCTSSELCSSPSSSPSVPSFCFSFPLLLSLPSTLFLTTPPPRSPRPQCLSFPWEVQCLCDLGRSRLRLSVQLAPTALSRQSLEKMQLYLVLLLISYLLTPIGASILGRCVVAKKLYDGGLNYFEGYSLENWVCLAYFESKFNPSAVYENSRDGSTGFGLFQIRDNEWCDHGKNLCSVSCTALLNPNLKDTIECAKKIVKGKQGMGAWAVKSSSTTSV